MTPVQIAAIVIASLIAFGTIFIGIPIGMWWKGRKVKKEEKVEVKLEAPIFIPKVARPLPIVEPAQELTIIKKEVEGNLEFAGDIKRKELIDPTLLQTYS